MAKEHKAKPSHSDKKIPQRKQLAMGSKSQASNLVSGSRADKKCGK